MLFIDGFQLLESGECRHKHDGDVDGAGGKFKSRLSGALRKDGVTRKFKSQLGYTEYGFDEWNDPDVGIKRVLLDNLIELTNREEKSEKIILTWEDSTLDQHETQRDLLSKEMLVIYKSFVDRMNQLLASRGANKLTLIAEDKGERITWGMLDIKRSGNKFTISSPGGSIPIGWTVTDWEEIFALEPQQQPDQPNEASAKPIKKRLNILESSDEEDDAPKKQPARKLPPPAKRDAYSSSGLDVVMRKATDVMENANLRTKETSSSIDDIKRQLGVSARQLEEGRDQLDNENRTTSMAACADELNEAIAETFGKDSSVLEKCMMQWKRILSHNYLPIEHSLEGFQVELRDKFLKWKREGERLSRELLKTGQGHVNVNEVRAPTIF